MSPSPPVWGPPYSQAELDDAQRRFGLRFPPDLVALFRTKRLAQGYDWTRDDVAIREKLEWPFEGLLFDVENNDLWWPEWGARPEEPERRKAVLRAAVAAAPKLIPLYGHRFIPETPHEAGNPVFSVYQADIIYYGRDLDGYVEREFLGKRWPVAEPVKTIRFWSEMEARAGRSTREG